MKLVLKKQYDGRWAVWMSGRTMPELFETYAMARAHIWTTLPRDRRGPVQGSVGGFLRRIVNEVTDGKRTPVVQMPQKGASG